MTSDKKKIILWGTGVIANDVLSKCCTLDNYEILGVIDNDVNKQGKRYRSYEIFSPDIIGKVDIDCVVILTDAYDSIKKQIEESFPQFKQGIENKNYFFKESILKRYAGTSDEEILKVIDYIKIHGLNIFNYSFVDDYANYRWDVCFDKCNGMFYANHYGKRLYLSRKFDTYEKACAYYKSIVMEQNAESPHRYCDDDFNVSKGDIVVDCGVAEGNFALEIVDVAKEIYLIEADNDWIDALKLTFKDYLDKVHIINAFITSYDEGKFVRLDSLLMGQINFIKMDIEGNEWDALLGARKTIEQSKKLKMVICCYHSDFDQVLIESFMDELDIKHYPTNGYMWFPYTVRQNNVSTRLNRALIRGIKDGCI